MPGSFAFRVACYDRFHWTPDVVRGLTESEAVLLAVYFDEVAYAEAKAQEDAKNAPAHSASAGWHTDLEVGGDDDDEEDE